jgi:hypothetical protein
MRKFKDYTSFPVFPMSSIIVPSAAGIVSSAAAIEADNRGINVWFSIGRAELEALNRTQEINHFKRYHIEESVFRGMRKRWRTCEDVEDEQRASQTGPG